MKPSVKIMGLLANLRFEHNRMRLKCLELYGALPGGARHTKVSRQLGEIEARFKRNHDELRRLLMPEDWKDDYDEDDKE